MWFFGIFLIAGDVKSIGTGPRIVKGVLDATQCEHFADALLRNAKEHKVIVQTQYDDATSEESTTLDKFCRSHVFDSSHDGAKLIFDEDLLDDCAPEVAAGVRAAVDTLFKDESWFDWFPDFAKPRDCAVLAGQGARSTLHRDPFEWTGLNTCLEGSKLWRFVRDDADLLAPYRLTSSAWGGLSVGWQSDESLFKRRKATVPTARALAEMDDDDRRSAIDAVARDDLLEASVDVQYQTLVQHAGDLVVIPAGWYHQTYSVEPSLAIASQRCGLNDAPTVSGHSRTPKRLPPSPGLDLTRGPDIVVPILFDHLHRFHSHDSRFIG